MTLPFRPGQVWIHPTFRRSGDKSDLDHMRLLPPGYLLLRTTRPRTAGDSSEDERQVPFGSPRQGNATTDANRIRAWWTRWLTANVNLGLGRTRGGQAS